MEVTYLQASEIREKLCKTLYFFRGANANVLTQCFNGSLNYTQQQKKQITNQLVRLKETGIITSKRLEGKDAGSMYFLSPMGLELVYKLLNINPLQWGTMWQRYPIEKINYQELKEYDYDTYKPPVRQDEHHHLILKSIVSLFGNDSDLSKYLFRLTLDATEKYIYKHQEQLLKPDVEIKVGDEIYTLEIDRATESYSQLVAKFNNYKNYIEYAMYENIETPITKIIFVYDDKNSQHGVSRRWETIMKAFLEGMNIKTEPFKWPPIELLYVKLSNLPGCIKYLKRKDHYNLDKFWSSLYLPKIMPLLEEQITMKKRFEDCSIIAVNENNKQIILAAYYPYFTSEFYRQTLLFKREWKNSFDCFTNYSKPKLLPVIISGNKKEKWKLNWKKANIDNDVKFELDYIYEFIEI